MGLVLRCEKRGSQVGSSWEMACPGDIDRYIETQLPLACGRSAGTAGAAGAAQ